MNDYLTAPHWDGDLDVSDIPRKRCGLRYAAPDGSLRPFDLYYPDQGEGPFPLIVNVSGGGWYYGHPSSIHLGRAVHTAAARGYALASIACTSSREKKFPYQVQEVRCALRHLRAHAGELALDPGFFALWSSSSEAHLSLLAAPITHVHPDMPPIMLLHGTADTVIPYTYTVELASALRRLPGQTG